MRIISTHKISISFAPILYYQFNCSPIFRRIINRKFVKIHLIIIIFMVLFRWILLSLPTRGAWIEMPSFVYVFTRYSSLPTQGAWIEITKFRSCGRYGNSRSLHRERGLKFIADGKLIDPNGVAPYTGSVD